MFALPRKSSALFLSLALLLPVLTCFCWAQVEAQACHAAAEMSDCCCSREVEVSNEAPDPVQAFLAPTLKLPEPQLCVAFEGASFSVLESFHTRQAEVSGRLSWRPSPALYLLNTSFLI